MSYIIEQTDGLQWWIIGVISDALKTPEEIIKDFQENSEKTGFMDYPKFRIRTVPVIESYAQFTSKKDEQRKATALSKLTEAERELLGL